MIQSLMVRNNELRGLKIYCAHPHSQGGPALR
jgi:hypothetical protein